MNYEEELKEKIIKLALLQLNKAYEHGKHGPDTFDCAGFVWYIYHEILGIDLYDQGIGLSTTTKIMTDCYGKKILYEDNSLNKELKTIKKGDILFFHRQSKEDTIPKEDNKYPGHCGIYLYDNSFIHCSRKNGMVLVNNFDESKYWKKILVAKKDFFYQNTKNNKI